jgi:hypothetical protein
MEMTEKFWFVSRIDPDHAAAGNFDVCPELVAFYRETSERLAKSYHSCDEKTIQLMSITEAVEFFRLNSDETNNLLDSVKYIF